MPDAVGQQCHRKRSLSGVRLPSSSLRNVVLDFILDGVNQMHAMPSKIGADCINTRKQSSAVTHIEAHLKVLDFGLVSDWFVRKLNSMAGQPPYKHIANHCRS